MKFLKTKIFLLFLCISPILHAELSTEDKKKFGNYLTPVSVHSKQEYDYVKVLFISLKLRDLVKVFPKNNETEAQKILRARDICKSLGVTYSEIDFIKLNSKFQKPADLETINSNMSHIDTFTNKMNLSPDTCKNITELISTNPERFIAAYSE
ncbi:MAG: hypothetical protein H7Z73_03335 [Candidatus Saccharibacteria bacterium]|nr:hypothetical protein [Moraxellaceae bacterium]